MSHLIISRSVSFVHFEKRFGVLFPFGKLFRFVSYIGFTLGLHDFLLKFHALYAGPCHMFARDFHL